MNVDYTLEEIKSGLDAWTELVTPVKLNGAIHVNKEQILAYLNQGFCFRITAGDFKKWSAQRPEYLHAYPAIFDRKLKFVLIDSKADQKIQDTTDNITVKDFHYGDGISDLVDSDSRSKVSDIVIPLKLDEALHRNFIWKMHCNTWLDYTLSRNYEIFKAISIPFADCLDLFKPDISDEGGIVSGEEQLAIAFLGLTKYINIEQIVGQDSLPLSVELILTSEMASYNLPNTFFDISRPVPPFGIVPGIEPENCFKLLPVVSQ